MAASFDPDSPPTTARSSTPSTHAIPTDETIENVIERATASARAANGGRSPVIGRDTRTQLFVGNLPYRVRWQDLKDLFRKAGGTVLRADVCLGPDNRSRGYGTVLLASAEDAGRAIDMFNGYVWQTRTLEVRPDRLPNDFDSSALAVGSGPMSKLTHSLSPQPAHYSNPLAAPSAIHPLGISSLSSPAPTTSLSSSNPASNSLGHSTLGMTTGVPSVFAQESSILSNSDSVRASLVAEMSRSPSAIKLPPTSSTPSNTFDTLGMTSNGLVSSSHTPIPSSSVGFGSSDPARRSLLIRNWPLQYGKSDFDQIFRTAGTILQSELPASNGSDNLGYGTVVYATEEEAKNAVAQLHGLELNGRRLSIRIGKPDQLSKSQLAASQERRKSDEMHLSTTPAPSVAPTATEASYAYPSYISMPPPMAPAGYLMASPPQSPYDQYPPAVAYALPSPTSNYPPPLNGGMYAYGTWAHQPHKPPSPPTAPLGGSNSSSGAGASGSTAPATNGSTNRIPPGTISLPSPSLTGYPPPAQMSPMHLPPITPSVPSFTFFSQPMPTPPVHPPYHMSPGLAPYSPLGSPGLYRHVNPYFNLSPGAPVPYHHDANAVANNGVIGSGVGGMMPNGQVPTPYFDMTAATAGSDAPQEYFPPMPVSSLTGVMHAMQISNNSNMDTTKVEEQESSFLEPVGVGRDGFPSLNAKPDEQKASDGVSRTGLTEWVTTPDDLPGSGSKDAAGTPNEQPSRRRDSPSAPAERSVSADPAKTTTPSSVGTTGSTSPGSSGGTGRNSSGKKPKLTLGSIPGFSPPVMMKSGYAAIMSNGVNGPNVVANRAAAQVGGAEQYRVNGSPMVLNAAAAHAARTNSSGGLGDDAHGHRRNSWTAEDASRRQAISPELHGEGYVR